LINLENMDKKWENLTEKIEFPSSGILSKEIESAKSDKFDATLFCMAKGSALSEHTATREGIVYVIEGKGKFNLEGKNIPMESGIFIHMKNNAIHSLVAEENTAFILYLLN